MKTMKSAQLTALNRIEFNTVPKPQIQNDKDVLIRMTTVGVCGSDVHYYKTGKIGSQVVEYPFAVGHEGAGIIEEVGAAVSRVKVGDRIAIEPGIACGECDQCRCGRHHTCRKLLYLGCPGQLEGCLCEYIVMPEECCFPIPDSMSLEEAALSEPLSIGVYAVQQSMDMRGKSIAILGAGPIGLSVLLPAKAQGAERIFVTDKLDERLALAKSAGTEMTVNVLKEDAVEKISQAEPLLLDAVFECCGEQSALDQAVKLLKPGGKLMLIGIPESDRVSFCIDNLRRKELCIQNVRRQCNCVQKALDMIEAKDFDVNIMTTHRFKFSQTVEAFEMVADYADGVVKAIIEM